MGDVLGGMQPYGRFLAGMGRNISKGGQSDQFLARAGKKKLTKKRARQLGLTNDSPIQLAGQEAQYIEDTSEADALAKKALEEEDRLIRKEDRELRLKRATPFHELDPGEQEAVLEGMRQQAEARSLPREPRKTQAEKKLEAAQGLVGTPGFAPVQMPAGEIPSAAASVQNVSDMVGQPGAVGPGGVAGQAEPPMSPEQHAAASAGAQQARPAPTKRESGKLAKLTPEERAIVASGGASVTWGVSQVEKRELQARKEQDEKTKARIKELEEIQKVEKNVSALQTADPSLDEKRARDIDKMGFTAKEWFNKQESAAKEERKAQQDALKVQQEQAREDEISTRMGQIEAFRSTNPDVAIGLVQRARDLLMSNAAKEDKDLAKEFIQRATQQWPELKQHAGRTPTQPLDPVGPAELRRLRNENE